MTSRVSVLYRGYKKSRMSEIKGNRVRRGHFESKFCKSRRRYLY